MAVKSGKVFAACIMLFLISVVSAAGQGVDLSLGDEDIRLEYAYAPDNTTTGYYLFVRKKAGVESIMLVAESHYYALRALEWNECNGNETRYLNGKPLVTQYARFSIIDSTPENNVFLLFLPLEMVWGYPWAQHGTVYIAEGAKLYIRAYTSKYADDTTGKYQDNQFVFAYKSAYRPPVAAEPPPALIYLPPAEIPDGHPRSADNREFLTLVSSTIGGSK